MATQISEWENILKDIEYRVSHRCEYGDIMNRVGRASTSPAGALICDAMGIGPDELDRQTECPVSGNSDLEEMICIDRGLYSLNYRFYEAMENERFEAARRLFGSIKARKPSRNLLTDIQEYGNIHPMSFLSSDSNAP